MSPFEKELAELINRYSGEKLSDTPDFILARFLNDCLQAYNRAVIWKEKWDSPGGVPVGEQFSGPKVELL
jgi:hypothetical protein